ncbi:MAG TPA: site-specific integrase [Acidimicrobiales bacterium]|jgi:integrase|nr:site-specific integrase [Acidimicrobiales bacterium]
MRGYVVKKGKQYYAVIYEGIDPGTGRERRRWVPGGPRRSDAERLVTDLVRRSNDGLHAPRDSITVGEYLIDRWLPLQRTQLRPSTFDSYRRNLELHVVPRIGRLQLQKLRPDDLDALYVALLAEGRKDRPGGLSPKSVRSVHLILHKALKDAVRKGLLTRNVADAADAPRLGAARRPDVKAWAAPELRLFLDAMKTHQLYAAFHLAAFTGMRRGEVLGLRTNDLDLAQARLSVKQAVISVAYEVQVSDVKTGSARRTVDLDPTTVATLRSHLRKRRATSADGLVFSRPDGSPIHPDLFSQIFDRTVAKLTVPKISLHDLRHTHATLLLKAGVPVKVVSERLGHASPAFTMTVYQHVIPGMQAEAAATFLRVLEDDDEPARPPADDLSPPEPPGLGL